jgi:hypothetical protein
MSKQFVIVDVGCNILWCGTDRAEADRVADGIESEHGREVTIRERSETDKVPAEVEVS